MEKDVLLSNVVRFLIEGQEVESAKLLLLCSVEEMQDISPTNDYYSWVITLRAPRVVYDSWEVEGPFYESIERAFKAVLPTNEYLERIMVRVSIEYEVNPDWREELLAIVHGQGIHNQGTNTQIRVNLWNDLRFYSKSEIRIAEALDRAGVLFLPNCLSRLGSQDRRFNREVDFIVCHQGKWGAIEVDGGPFHPAERSAIEGERDRLLKAHGIKIIERFDSDRCDKEPDKVVKQFLFLLSNS